MPFLIKTRIASSDGETFVSDVIKNCFCIEVELLSNTYSYLIVLHVATGLPTSVSIPLMAVVSITYTALVSETS